MQDTGHTTDTNTTDELNNGILDEPPKENKPLLTILNCNARSLCPKIESLIDCFNETDCTVAIITETWLRGGKEQEDVRELLEEGNDLSFITKNRPEPAANGVHYGGVAAVWRNSRCSMKEVSIVNPNNYEILVTAGKLSGHTRKLVVLSCYIPPGYARSVGEGALDFINDAVVHVKQLYTDPYIIVAGDFNQWDISGALTDFPDLREAPVGQTRGDLSIDKIFTNLSRQ